MKRWLGIFAIGLIAAAALAAMNQRAIGQFLFERAVERQVGIDPTEALPDGLHAYVCGSGSPLPDAERAGPCIAVLAGQSAFVFDAGSGSIRKLGWMGFPMQKLDAAFLTHLHSDHLDGLGELMLQAWMAGARSSPLPIYGPPGTDRVVAGLMQAYAIDRGYRIAHHGPKVARPGGFGGEARIVSFDDAGDSDGLVYAADGVTIHAVPVEHAPVDNAYAYRVDYKGRSLVISGDTRFTERLARFAKGADVLFHEALNPQMVGTLGKALAEHGNADAASIMADIPAYHTSPDDAARVAQRAGVDMLVFYHLLPAPPTELMNALFVGDAHRIFAGRIEVSEDGTLVSLPARSQDIRVDRLL